ncbi:Protein byr4 [Tolypocladium ophioglossoides CBS 100239]|uniref:Protein byr4 n=1 Tax=Tolypocladium ophioglossoides (strain CBS 100239) TaxID=1163406 RepID=A0A0L0NL51_TOLOC|nr:Protein byr4 [Tolypocladium ophioglossoides CBS 100239]
MPANNNSLHRRGEPNRGGLLMRIPLRSTCSWPSLACYRGRAAGKSGRGASPGLDSVDSQGRSLGPEASTVAASTVAASKHSTTQTAPCLPPAFRLFPHHHQLAVWPEFLTCVLNVAAHHPDSRRYAQTLIDTPPPSTAPDTISNDSPERARTASLGLWRTQSPSTIAFAFALVAWDDKLGRQTAAVGDYEFAELTSTSCPLRTSGNLAEGCFSEPRQRVADDIENWDDEDFVVDGDDLSFRSSVTTTMGNTTHGTSRRRDSNSSHVSLRSDLESWHGEEKQLHLPADDESSTMDAIAAAEHAGIPLPKNIPSSALMGGTIKRLGGRKIRKIIQEDWENDLELPDTSQGLAIKPKNETDFPDTLRQVSDGSVQTSPKRATKLLPGMTALGERRNSIQSIASALSSALDLGRFKDTEDDDFFGDGCDTIKVSKSRPVLKPVSFITPPTPRKTEKKTGGEDDFERDLELPSDGKLRLSTRRDIPKTPSSQAEELDWGEGSLGTRYGGTRRDGRSNRSSSASAMSPSVSSSITAESEDETFDGLVLPPGPVNFKQRLQHRKKSTSPERIPEEPEPSPKKPAAAEVDRQDFFDGLDVGDGKVFDSGKLTLHRNIKVKEAQPASPARPKTAVSLTFTNKAPTTRIPRLSHERAHSTSLEPVYESGGSIFPQRNRWSQSRLGHSSQSSVTSLPTPTTISPGRSLPPSTPQRREVGARSTFSSLRTDPLTTSAQLLKQKRSLPAVRALNTPAKPMSGRSDRPPSRTDANRPQSGLRPKTPVERQRAGITESPATQPRRTHLPFLPAGASQAQSQHVASKTLRQFRRHDSDNAIDIRPFSRSISRSGMRSPSPHRYKVAADTWERLSKPKNKKHFGDGHELDAFDDLPTSREAETRFLKQPMASGPKVTMRSKVYQTVLPVRTCTPAPSTPFSPARMTQTPRFARDTAASRIARETARAQRVPSSGPLAPVTAQREAQLATRNNLGLQPHVPQHAIRSKKRSTRPPQLKPHLIANLNTGKESKIVNGMFYNAETFCWEGNENALNAFDNAPVSTPSSTTVAQHLAREKEASTPRPALITNISATKGVQVVGGMVFDPENMCWLKLDQQSNARSEAGDPMEGFNALEDDEDVFKDIPDLEDKATAEERGEGRASDIKDDWLVGEEFDVGPEFVRRQREEEDRWRKKCEKWVGRGLRDREMWRWTIRDLVSQFDDRPM